MADKKAIIGRMCAFLCGAFVTAAAVGTVQVQAAEPGQIGEVTGDGTSVKDGCMQKIFENLTKAGSRYTKAKAQYKDPETGEVRVKFTESCADDKISIRAEAVDKTAEDYEWYKSAEGSWDFVLDGDDLTFTTTRSDIMGASLFSMMAGAVYDYLGMDEELADGLISATDAGKVRSDNYQVVEDKAAGKYTIRVKVSAAWNIGTALDGVYVDDAYLQNYGIKAIGSKTVNHVISLGKLRVYIYGNKKSLDVSVAEYGGRSDLTYKSLIALARVFKPAEYQTFLKAYTALKPAEGKSYSITFPTNKSEMAELFGELSDNFAYTKTRFFKPAYLTKTAITLKAGAAQEITVENGTVVSWKSSKPKVASVKKDGTVAALKKGMAKITAKLANGDKLICKVKVKNNPAVKVAGKAFQAKKIYIVKAKKTLKVQLFGKSDTVKNAYSTANKKIAKVTSKKTADIVKIKGIKKGKTTIGITVNGVKYTLKIKVK